MSILDQSGNPMRPRRGRGFYSMVGTGESKAPQGEYRGKGVGAKEQIRKAGDKMKEAGKSMKDRVEEMRPRERLAEAYDGTVNYMMGKPTAIELADQFNIALTGNQAADKQGDQGSV